MKTDYVRARVKPELKAETERIFEGLGLSTSDAINLFLHQVQLKKALPFLVSLSKHHEVMDFELEERIQSIENKKVDLISEKEFWQTIER